MAINFLFLAIDLQLKSFSYLDDISLLRSLGICRNLHAHLDHSKATTIWLSFCQRNQLELEPRARKLLKENTPISLRKARKVAHIARMKYTNHFCSITPGLPRQSLLRTYRRLTQLPYYMGRIGELSQLEVLDISHNRISFFPPSFSSLTSLTDLDISHNLFSGCVPVCLSALVNLRVFIAKNNAFTHLDDSFSSLPQLEHCDLSSNILTGLCDTIGNCRQLQVLNCSNNKQLTRLPESIFALNLSAFSLELTCLSEEQRNAVRSKAGFREKGNSEELRRSIPLTRSDTLSHFTPDLARRRPLWRTPISSRTEEESKEMAFDGNDETNVFCLSSTMSSIESAFMNVVEYAKLVKQKTTVTL